MRIRPVIVHNQVSRFVCCSLLPRAICLSSLGLSALAGSSLAACNKSVPEPPAQSTTAESKPAATTPDEPVSAPPQAQPAAKGAVSWPDPEGWTRGPERPMRKATYVVPAAPGAAEGELAVFYFGQEQGGDVEANIQRWVGQFSDIKPTDIQRSERTVNDLQQFIVEVPKGTYTNSMAMHGPKGPQPDFSLLGAVVDSPAGKYFFKLTGPEKTVQAAKAKFFKMLDETKLTQ